MIGLITVPYWWHATLLEVVWLAGGLIALPGAVWNVSDVAKDEEILAELRDDPTVHSRHYFMIYAAHKGATLDHWLTVVTAAVIIVVGTVGCVVSNPLGGHTTVTGFVITLALLLISGNTAVRAYAALITRRRLYELAAGRTSVLAAKQRARHLPPS